MWQFNAVNPTCNKMFWFKSGVKVGCFPIFNKPLV